MPEPVPQPRAIDGRRLVQLIRDSLEPRQDRDAEEGDAAPDVGQQTDEMANFGSPRKLMFCLMSPRFLNNQETGLNTGSKIMNQPRVDSAVGTI